MQFRQGAHALAFEYGALGTAFALQVADIGVQFQKAVLHLLRRVGGNKCAFALAAHDQIFSSQLINGFAHGSWLTLKRAASSISLGINSPGRHSPACRLCRIKPLICWYRGLKAGVSALAELA